MKKKTKERMENGVFSRPAEFFFGRRQRSGFHAADGE